MGGLWASLFSQLSWGEEISPAQARAIYQKTIPWTDQATYRPCDLSCSYKKANEVLSLYGFYHIKMLAEDIREEQSDDLRAKKIVSRFPQLGLLGLQDEELVAVYEQSVKNYIEASAQAIEGNMNEIGKLEYRGSPGFGYVARTKPAKGTASSKDPANDYSKLKAQIPYFAKTQDLLEAQSKTEENAISKPQKDVRDLGEWVAAVKKAPQRENIKLFKKVARDPDDLDPNGDKILVPVRCGSEQCVDDKRFRKKLAEFEKKLPGDVIKKMDDSVSSVSTAGSAKNSGISIAEVKSAQKIQTKTFKRAKASVVEQTDAKLIKQGLIVGTTPVNESKDSKTKNLAVGDQKNRPSVPQTSTTTLPAPAAAEPEERLVRAQDVRVGENVEDLTVHAEGDYLRSQADRTVGSQQ